MNTRRPSAHLLRPRRLITIAAVAALSLLGPAAPAVAQDDAVPVDILVVDDDGRPFPEGAGVIACPVEGFSVPCSSLVFGADHDGDGHVDVTVDPDVMYRANAFVTNTGWDDPHFIVGDTTFHFSAAVEVPGSDLDGRTFVVHRPKADAAGPTPGTVIVELKVLDGNGSPFPLGTAGAIFCASTGCAPTTYGQADGKGVVRIALPANVQYDVSGYVANPGWACGHSTLDGYFLSDMVTRRGAQLLRPTVLTITQPSCAN